MRAAIRDQWRVFLGVVLAATAAVGVIWAFSRPIPCGSRTDSGPYVAGISAGVIVGLVTLAIVRRRVQRPLLWGVVLAIVAAWFIGSIDAARWIGSCAE